MLKTVLQLSRTGCQRNLLEIAKCSMSSEAGSVGNFKTLAVSVPQPYVYHVELNRADRLNALNNTMWLEIGECFTQLGAAADCRAVVLSGAGKLFCSGLDFQDMMTLGSKLSEEEDVARRCKILSATIKAYQNSLTALEKCHKPVIGAVHNACIGGGINLIAATDIRYCTNDAWFQVKEVDLGLTADVGVLQRLPRLIGNASLVNELCFTARKLPAAEAAAAGLVSKLFDTKDSMIAEAVSVAKSIAEKSPVAVQGTKRSLLYSREHTVQEGLDHVADWNQIMLQSEDFMNASVALATKSPPPIFSKL
ncbi:delta(3,5)-Delta(2,4)-dienoyl-CoA isomerase, mitochondrial isoform X1 [Macrosteles quadrilineatus]|uniref:delta(3,5)-Delta(2,4)-dienoyl-CoA isomerase, mitochondrial isoform X1 n=2 Tax=Macrosteles quadrilineatus TaxID=74068 RepID=UPI0023E1DB4E|nr:delta(3,5)-Delta(2,4)-dienoyl-CoA isomerase, mitochondrial isoform X1 [Macrosteles quadrilineatus]